MFRRFGVSMAGCLRLGDMGGLGFSCALADGFRVWGFGVFQLLSRKR